MKKKCLYCKKEFEQTTTSKGYIIKFQKFCSNKCRSNYYNNYQKKERCGKTRLGKSKRHCKYCGKWFIVKAYNQKFCSRNCTDLFHYVKNKGDKLKYMRDYRLNNLDRARIRRRRYSMNNKKKESIRHLTYVNRDEFFKHLGRKCMTCGSKKNIQFHHKSYDIFKPLLKITKVLCKNCHIELHKKIRNK